MDTPMIASAHTTHIISNHLDERKKVQELIRSLAASLSPDKEAFVATVREALYTRKIIIYAQDFSLTQDASRLYGQNLDLGKIASTFRTGCTIQAVFLNDITHASGAGPKPENLISDRFFLSCINEHQDNPHRAVSTDVINDLPIPALYSAVSYLDEFQAEAAGANLIRTQHDCLGVHAYERTNREGVFHHEWRWINDNQH